MKEVESTKRPEAGGGRNGHLDFIVLFITDPSLHVHTHRAAN